MPFILGHDMSGEVAAVGASVLCLTVGQEVYGTSLGFSSEGTFADYVQPYELIGKPKLITHEEVSAIPFAAPTRWTALIRIAEIREGQRVLVNGGDEATGFAAIQLAVTKRCRVVATCRCQNIDRVLAASLEQAIDYTAEDIKSVKGQFDVVLDTLGGAQFEKIGISVLKRKGHYIVLPVR
ncbi:reticulon-4-interacting protein 1 homolog, mitochondrial-like [Rhodamnia argentea]|uniref:Reticulon-4-interacting protein 1 homolog, mitochondrial-like n=1 Tax=Rhodamnia argentea TaxID=178133 RepID=A0ABM3GYY5_9MYRT|nr:reticulon-4-interacting protein 1 homolog, mitochondrial-like [Rhodamnia argentea]